MSTGGAKQKVFLTSGAEAEVVEDFFGRPELKKLSLASVPSEADWLILRTGECAPEPFVFSHAKNGYSLYRRGTHCRRSIW
ncbi:MAG: hypothetical protein A3J30_01420 [Candidatus Wildermuthbacteria bacterium RIFCSPLOWO2_02_FULL_47_9c]|uniref:Uncharacterized protein n=1 Tax=Candidatus Wildermuthbacteria bacterium RIFCSPLOWO2_02_FULL_47_9c TaxID=1802466 RepID=A0A1G2RTD5_9BACT|nr:MAG: hypothetical protein UY53_C0008G0031 [Parcubacteria group bacterium GW2011_GWA2_50_10]OHA61817.1 MAG: hypothetical protein A2109_00530 [Candidatus Wildermuthbacteria bacterium GWA1_49_26]OHA65326.1 MAG: hypothetical protein A2674_00735 [Candidatus Wildermuthbacteria bacterium RIFCSPHIGHO2_01_FULL_50_47]OHA69553.1 MAG: hypothetical protein A3D63_03080 [Candidatus Wildermuthbacteria bacterium RIFCSPHIGHO2_02_FULL_49_17]OHA72197.1 MAG: hypothetical protein A3E08_03055 [Candidatus Wildermut